jgi:hypothetical protein
MDQGGLLEDVLARAPGVADRLERHAERHGVGESSTLAVLFLRVAGPDGAADPHLVAWAVERALDGRRIRALPLWGHGPTSGSVGLVIADPAHRITPGMIGRLVDEIQVVARRQDPALAVSCGQGRRAASLAECGESLREAAAACAIGTRLKGAGSISDYDDLGAYPVLYEALRSRGSGIAATSLQERYLGAALRYEATTGLPLIDTLAVYFEQRGNVSATARALRINRQSLLYRLERFETLSGVNLTSPRDRFAVELAIRLSWVREDAAGTDPMTARAAPAASATRRRDGRRRASAAQSGSRYVDRSSSVTPSDLAAAAPTASRSVAASKRFSSG